MFIFLLEQKFIVEKAFHLLSGMIQITLAREYLNTTYAIIILGQLIVQAVSDSSAYLLQLPGITTNQLSTIKEKKKNIKTIRDLLDLQEIDRR